MTWTATLGAGVTLVVLAGVTFSLVFLKAWPRPRTVAADKEAPLHSSASSALETALATLVMDFVKEREMRRTVRAAEAQAEARTHVHPAGRPVEPTPRAKKEDSSSHIH